MFSLNATMPIFLVMILGWALMRVHFFSEEFVKTADKYVFKVALPVLLFQDIATADITEVMDMHFVLFCMISTILMFLGVWLFSWLFIRDKSMVGAFAQAAARGSAAILGIAFVQNIYGDSGMAPLMIISAVPFYNILSVIILTFHSKDQAGLDKKVQIRNACINVAKNPIIWGILTGLLFALSGLSLPVIPAKAISYVANTATPIALLTIGAGFQGKQALSKIRPALAACFIKLIALPAIFFPFALYFGFRQSELVAILVMLGSPTTVSCYIMAKNMGNDEVLTSSVIVLATLLSSITLTGWIYLLRTFGLI
jgi:hypothetical protein